MQRFFGARELFVFSLLTTLAFLFFCERRPSLKPYFPETGRNALYQRSLDLRGNLNILSIAIQPGYEDLAALAYFRLGRGATIMSAYVTNGEAGESDIQAEYPPYLAAIHQREASKALSYLDGGVYFLNMSDIGAARDTAKVRESWSSDTLQIRLIKLISQYKPDIVIVARDWGAGGKSLRWQVLYSDVLTAVKKIASNKQYKRTNSKRFWDVDRVFVDDGESKAILIPVNERHPRWKKTYRIIGEEAARSYVTLAIQRRIWMKRGQPSYRLVYPSSSAPINEIDAGLPKPSTARLRWIAQQIEQLTNSTLQGKTKGALKQLVAIMDSVDFYIVRRYKLQPHERKALLHWYRGLENLRCTLLGVEVKFSISDTLLTERQLTFLTIDKVKGITDNGNTDIYFAGFESGWAINEDLKKRLPLKLHQKYRLLTPAQIDYNFPPGSYKLQSSTSSKSFNFFIIHRAPSKERSFVHRTTLKLSFAPRFITEILTPIVRMVPGEWIIYRLMNISRDGVTDTIRVNHSFATSAGGAFRLSHKQAVHLDTLLITWKGKPTEGSYIIPLQIAGMTVARFAARKFNTVVDTSKKVGIITGLRNSSARGALRRLNVKFSTIRLGRTFSRQIDTLDVLIIDRRALTLKPRIGDYNRELDNFVNRGGHLIVLAQDATSWNANPLWDGMQLTPTLLFDESVPLQVDSTDSLLTFPNPIGSDDWSDWLFRRGYNVISGNALKKAKLPVKVKQAQLPLIVSLTEGKGKRTYVDLALGYQWMNIQAGTFRLLANLISY